ncbi:MAG TPA: MarC family protein [Sphingomonadaceae bacterium]|jgi:multiple antibiotic resistance protein|nr:MarC family protein [Sphingomonadaceae bacterium]
MSELLAPFTSALVTFLLVIDPPGCAPIFASLTREASAAQRRSMAVRAVVIGAAILLFFAAFGEDLLRAIGVSLDAFRVAGGIMLFLIGLDMVFEKRTERREKRAEEINESTEVEDVSVFPMAIPMIAGPGSIATVMLISSRTEGLQASLVVFAALFLALLATLAALLAAGPLLRVLGARIEAVITRILGVLLAALAAQFIIDGLRASFA